VNGDGQLAKQKRIRGQTKRWNNNNNK
jgi:hypothetical protein